VPAGAQGFVRIENGYFFAGPERLRIWGVNTCFGANFPTHNDAGKVAARLCLARDSQHSLLDAGTNQIRGGDQLAQAIGMLTVSNADCSQVARLGEALGKAKGAPPTPPAEGLRAWPPSRNSRR
jgi:hypothetical protein